MSAKQATQRTESQDQGSATDTIDIKQGISRVLEILRSLPTIRRYEDDTAVIKEAQEILERVKGEL